jgi:ABC-type multidrug transport system fused ATPase/permease subunit
LSTSAGRRTALRLLVAAAARYRGALLFGALATVGVVAMRLALPWPLRGVVENVFPPAAGEGAPIGASLEFPGGPVVAFCVIYFLLAVGTGVFEWVQRVWMARAASLTAHDLRGAAVEATARGSARTIDRADLITRIIGDSARLRADLKGILVHLTQNTLLLLAITALFLVLAPKLGLLFLLSGLLATLIGYGTVEEVAETASRARRKESKYASAIHGDAEAISGTPVRKLNRSSAKKEVRITRIIGRSTLLVHAAVAATLGFAFWSGVQDVRHGTLAPGELFLFIAYAITIQRRAVMIGRQVARGGKLLATAQRIGGLIGGEREALPPPVATLRETMRLDGLRSRRGRVGPVDLTIRHGTRTLVLGGDGAGKSTFLRLLAGREPARRGRLLWDGQAVDDTTALWPRVAWLGDEVEFGGVTPRALLGLPQDGEPTADQVRLLELQGAWKIVCRLEQGLDQSVSSAELSRRERRTLALAGILLGDAPVWILDEPVEADVAKERARLQALLDHGANRTIVIGLRRPVCVDRFDRVVVLRKGKVDFEGTPAEWQLRRRQIRQIKRA